MDLKPKAYKFIIIGAGIAGLSAIKKIRAHNSNDSILLISNEDRLPYKRTKVNKHIAAGFSKEDFKLASEDWYKEQCIDLLYDEVLEIDKIEQSILTKKYKFTYNKMLIATGAQPNFPNIDGLAESNAEHVHFAKEVEALINTKLKSRHFLIIGGGVEGIETADQLCKMGKKVSIIQRSTNPLKDLFPSHISDNIYQKIATAGIEYIDNEVAIKINKKETQYEVVCTKRKLLVDEIILCAGSKPQIKIAKKAGLNTNRGILVNQYLQSSDEHIFAAGDVAEHPNGFVSGLWHPAEYQGYAAGENMLGKNIAYIDAPYRLKTEVFGAYYFSANFDQCIKLQAETIIESFGQVYRELYIKNGMILGICMMNDKEHAKTYQKAVAEKWTLSKFKENVPALK